MSTDHLEFYRGRSVLITGGLGFIGSNLTLKLFDLGANITVLDGLITDHGGSLQNIHRALEHIRLVVSRLNEPDIVRQAVDGVEVIFNLAGQVSHVDSVARPDWDLTLNTADQLSFLQALISSGRRPRVVFTATRQQYGRPRYLPIDEQHPLTPIDTNGIHKTAAESYHFYFSRTERLPVCSLRLTNTYGPRQLIRHARQGFMGWWTGEIIRGNPLTVYGNGDARRDLNYVDDVVDACLRAGCYPEAVGETFNLGATPSYTLAEIASTMVDVYGSGDVVNVPYPAARKNIEIGDTQSDFDKIRRRLGWEPRTTLRDGLAKTFQYFQNFHQTETPARYS